MNTRVKAIQKVQFEFGFGEHKGVDDVGKVDDWMEL
jgi:hypothetical protein